MKIKLIYLLSCLFILTGMFSPFGAAGQKEVNLKQMEPKSFDLSNGETVRCIWTADNEICFYGPVNIAYKGTIECRKAADKQFRTVRRSMISTPKEARTAAVFKIAATENNASFVLRSDGREDKITVKYIRKQDAETIQSKPLSEWDKLSGEVEKGNLRKKVEQYEELVTPHKKSKRSVDSSMQEMVRENLKQGELLLNDLHYYNNKVSAFTTNNPIEITNRAKVLDTLLLYQDRVKAANIVFMACLIPQEQRDSIYIRYHEDFSSLYDVGYYEEVIRHTKRILNTNPLATWVHVRNDNTKEKVDEAVIKIGQEISPVLLGENDGTVNFSRSYEKFIRKTTREFPVTEDIVHVLVEEDKNELLSKLYSYGETLTDLQKDVNAVGVPYLSYFFIVVAIVVVLFGLISYIKAYNKKKKSEKQERQRKEENAANNVVKVRRSGEMKYNVGLDEIIDSDRYYLIDMQELFKDTAVGKIYFEKDCLQDLYRFFAQTLKDPGKSKETGCYLLGRWEKVQDGANTTYNLSYEEIVMPGDDAIYGEYELNFGAKIGIKMATTVSSLCEKTKNHYVMASWVHSHPGLGIFLSNHDIIVQNQLIHKQHPSRLTAMVIDTLTPQMNFAIFTAKQNGEMNNKVELRKELALESILRQIINIAPQRATASDYVDVLPDRLREEAVVNKILFNGKSIQDIQEKSEANSDEIAGYFMGNALEDNVLHINRLEMVYELGRFSANEIKGCLIVNNRVHYERLLEKVSKLTLKPDFIMVYITGENQILCVPLLKSGIYSEELHRTPYLELLKRTRGGGL